MDSRILLAGMYRLYSDPDWGPTSKLIQISQASNPKPQGQPDALSNVHRSGGDRA